MPHLTLKLDVDRHGGFDGLHPSMADGIIHLGNDAEIQVGTLRQGMDSGKDSCALCFTLPDGRVVVAETSVDLLFAAVRAIAGWQEGRRERGET